AQPQQRRAIIATIVHLIAQAVEHRPGNYARSHGEDIPGELRAHHRRHHAGDAFDGLQNDIADKAVAHNHVDSALADVIALDVAMEVQTALAQQLGGLLDHLVALDDLFTNIQ